jgi:hypothetical protein
MTNAKSNLDAQAAPNVTLNNGILRYKGRVWIGIDATLKGPTFG